jgi:DNA-binding beta-propeller fold protein YncE
MRIVCRTTRVLPVLLALVAPAAGGGAELPAGAVVRVGPRAPDSAGGELDRIRLVALSPDGRRLATAGEPGDPTIPRAVHLWAIPSGEHERALVARDTMITSMSFSPDGTRLVTSSAEHPAGTQVWDVRTGREVASATGGNGFARIRRDGRLVVVDRFGTTDVVLVLDANTGNEIRRHLVPPNEKFDLTPDGRRLLAVRSDRSPLVYVHDVESGRQLARLEGCTGEPRAIAISPDGRTAAAVDGDDVLLWEVHTKTIVHRLQGHGEAVLRIAFTPEGRRLVTTSVDRTTRTWELATGGELHSFRGHESLVTALDVAADRDGRTARVATGSFDRTAIVWDTAATRRTLLPDEAPTSEDLLEAWNTLGSDDAAKAYRAIGLVAGHPDEAIAMLADRVHGTLVPAENERIRELVARLDDDDFRVRHRATRELHKVRGIAMPILLRTYETSLSEEVRDRIRRIVGNDANTPRFTRADRLRMFRIVQACEAVAGGGPGPGTDGAIEVLGEIVEAFPDKDIVREARETLARLRP